MWKPLLKQQLVDKANREKRRITQKHISEVTGIREPTISRWMQPDTRLTWIEADMVGKLAAYFECDPRALFEFVYEDDPAPIR